MREYQICTNCIMDTTDPEIKFDDKGVCDHCNNFYKNILPNWKPGPEGEKELMKIVAKIKEEGKDRDYDCLMGISGGVDSSYMAYLAKVKLGLRPLIFHIDAGWNSQQAVNNIERIIDSLNLDLHTEVINERPSSRIFQSTGLPCGYSTRSCIPSCHVEFCREKWI